MVENCGKTKRIVILAFCYVALLIHCIYKTTQGSVALYVLFIGTIISLLVFVWVNKVTKEAMADFDAKEREKSDKEKAMLQQKVADLIYSQTYPDKPSILNNEQWNEMGNFMNKAREFSRSLGAYNVFYDLTDEEIYCLLFIKKDQAPFKIIMPITEKVFDIYFKLVGNEVVCTSDLTEIKAYEKPDVELFPATLVKKKPSKGVLAARARHKRKMEALRNGKKIEKGKQVQPPNYEFLAKEWLTNNMGIISKKISDAFALAGNVTQVAVNLKRTELPEKDEVMKLVIKNLKDDKYIYRYEDSEDGIIIKVKK